MLTLKIPVLILTIVFAIIGVYLAAGYISQGGRSILLPSGRGPFLINHS